MHHLTVVGLIKKSPHAFSHHRADIMHGEELIDRGIHQRLQATEMPRQILGRGLTHMPNAQTVQKPRQAGVLGALQAGQQINDLVNYIVSFQDETQVPFEKNVCINPDATKAAVDEFLNGDLTKKPPAANQTSL